MVTVRPPPGVSSSASGPSIASTKPWAIEPETDAVAGALVAEALERIEHPRRSAGDAGPVVDDAQVHRVAERAASMRTGDPPAG